MSDKVIKLSDTWLKASILGASWAASEIILGSFLHNIHMPFKGNILTGIGFILMISVSYKWRDKGLYWRTGLICALMKTMSPSAVILGPMLAIFMESLLLEISVRLLGRNIFGFLLGAVLAMSWILFQKIANYIIFYGMNIIEIYDNLLKYAEEQLDIQTPIFWLPILILLGIYLVFGFMAVFIGMRIASDLSNNPNTKEFDKKVVEPLGNKKDEHFSYSMLWLIMSILALVTDLVLISNASLFIWMPLTLVIVILWIIRYKRAMRQISRPKFWVFFVIITVLSALLLSSFTESENKIVNGLLIGIQMNFRAAVVILGFTVISKELYNPVIRNLFAKSAFRQLSPALDLAFDSLPYVVSNIPSAKTFIKNPSSIIKILVYHAEERFEIMSKKQSTRVFIVSGGIAEGKTSFVRELATILKKEGYKLGGFYSPRVLENENTIGYDIVNINTNTTYPFLRKVKNESADIGKYKIVKTTHKVGKSLLSIENTNNKALVFIDEIGRLEIKDLGWSHELDILLKKTNLKIVLCVRSEYLEEVMVKFNITNYLVIPPLKDNLSLIKNCLQND